MPKPEIPTPHSPQPISSRGWTVTLNNYTAEEILQVKQLKTDFTIYGREVGETCQTPHLQIYFYKATKITFNSIQKTLKRAHLIASSGTPQQNKDYCSKGSQTKMEWETLGTAGPNYGKDADVWESGTLPSQGKRNDLKQLVENIVTNATSINQLIYEDPMAYHQYGRTLEKIEQLQKRKEYRTQKTTCEWIYGDSGTGKSYEAFANYNPQTHYNHQDDGLWWDNYNQQDIVIINEFRGEIKYKRLLELTDSYPCNVPQRNKPPIPFISRHIIITSSKSPEEIYSYLGDSMTQLLRRIIVRHKIKLPYLQQITKRSI